jgi:hypothetical protein
MVRADPFGIVQRIARPARDRDPQERLARQRVEPARHPARLQIETILIETD